MTTAALLSPLVWFEAAAALLVMAALYVGLPLLGLYVVVRIVRAAWHH